MRVVSLGAGVQSSAMLLMGLDGLFGDPPECAVFADTGWEPRSVYEWLARLREAVAPLPIHTVRARRPIRDEAASGFWRTKADGSPYLSLPLYSRQPDGRVGMTRRTCTYEYKVRPVRRLLRSMASHAELWIGISTDEAHRMKPSGVKWLTHRWPLIERRLSRADCAAYIKQRLGAEAPKSSCIGCPFKRDHQWRAMPPDEFEDACRFDEEMRKLQPGSYLHRSGRPLRDVALADAEQPHLEFGEECEGLCGV